MLEAIVGILALIVEILIYAVVGIVQLIRYACSENYREKRKQKKEEDRKTAPKRAAIALGVFALIFISGYPFSQLSEDPEPEPKKKNPNFTVEAEEQGDKTKLTFTIGGRKSSSNKVSKLNFTFGFNQSGTNKFKILNWSYTKHGKTKSFPNQKLEPAVPKRSADHSEGITK
jgi:Na+-transporting methylmalonyl-CoA/oxaloacetate decarboxylase gamma subunit